MTIDEAIQRENKIAEENQKIVDTEIVFDDVSLSQLYCDDTEVIEEHLQNYKKCAEYHKQLAEWLEELKSIKDGSIPIIHGKAELELHDREIRNKAIDDFNEKLMEQQIYDCMLPDGFRTDIVTSHTIDAIAEQLKAGDGE